MAKKERNSSLELLRIICMLLIITHHFAVHSNFISNETTVFNAFLINILSSFGKLGSNVFVMITGYFVVESKFKPRRVINVVALTIFYNSLLYVIFSAINSNFKFVNFLKSFFPIHNEGYWFVTTFVALSLLSPFINKMLHALTHIQHLLLVILLVLMQVYVPKVNSYFTLSSLAWFITLYVIGAYVRRYPNKIICSPLYMGISTAVFCSTLSVWKNATNMRDLVCLSASFAIFCLFNSINMKNIKIINLVAKTTFGVYLIHDSKFVRNTLWNKILKCPDYSSSGAFIFYAVVCIFAVFIVCSAIELCRILILKWLKSLYIKHEGEHFEKIHAKFSRE